MPAEPAPESAARFRALGEAMLRAGEAMRNLAEALKPRTEAEYWQWLRHNDPLRYIAESRRLRPGRHD